MNVSVDPAPTVDQRVDALLAQMTLEEKIAQMVVIVHVDITGS